MKTDGRKLRKDIKDYIKSEHTGKDPYFTVRSIVRKRLYKSDLHILEVGFDELDPDLLIWSDVADWVINVWWPNNKEATMSKKIWSGLYLDQASVEVPIDKVEVGYGFTHN